MERKQELLQRMDEISREIEEAQAIIARFEQSVERWLARMGVEA